MRTPIPVAAVAIALGAACAPPTPYGPVLPAPLLLDPPQVIAIHDAADGPSSRAADAGAAGSEGELTLLEAMASGVPLAGRGVLTVRGRDLVQVDMTSDARTVVARNIIPTPMHCVGIAAGAQAVFGCAADMMIHSEDALVFAWPSGERSPIEARMQTPWFWTSDDGAFMTMGRFECPTCEFSRYFHSDRDARPMYVRDRDGRWHRHLFDFGPAIPFALNTRDGRGPVPPRRIDVVLWVPRGDGQVVAVVNAMDGHEAWGVAYPDSDRVLRWTNGDATREARALLHGLDHIPPWGEHGQRNWTWTPTDSLRGWSSTQGDAGAVEITTEGLLRRIGPRFERVWPSGPIAVGHKSDGTVWETLDHGETWSAIDLHGRQLPALCLEGPDLTSLSPTPPAPCPPAGWCSAVGCDFVDWVRVGWGAPNIGSLALHAN